MRHCILIILPVLFLFGCKEEDALTTQPKQKEEPWSNEAELVFQHAEALKHSLEQQKLEEARIDDQGLEGRAPSAR